MDRGVSGDGLEDGALQVLALPDAEEDRMIPRPGSASPGGGSAAWRDCVSTLVTPGQPAAVLRSALKQGSQGSIGIWELREQIHSEALREKFVVQHRDRLNSWP